MQVRKLSALIAPDGDMFASRLCYQKGLSFPKNMTKHDTMSIMQHWEVLTTCGFGTKALALSPAPESSLGSTDSRQACL